MRGSTSSGKSAPLGPLAPWPARTVAALHRFQRPLMLGLLVAAVTVGAMAGNVRVDNSLEVWFLEDDPALAAYDDYKATYGNDEIITVAATDPVSVYRPAALERIRAASLALENHPAVRRVTSLALGVHAEGVADLELEADPTIENAAVDSGGIDVATLLPREGAITEEMAAALRAKVERDPICVGTIVGQRETMTLLLVEPKTFDDFDSERAAILADVESIAERELRRGGGDVHLGGIGVVYEGLNAASMRDSGVFVSLSYVVILAGLWLLFRRLIWVVVGAGIVTIAVVATIGIAGAAGRDLNMVTAVLPTLLMTIGILDLVHLIDAYEEGAAAGLDRRRILTASVAGVVVPCLFNTVTDAIGFSALASANMAAIRDLGWLAAVGLLVLVAAMLVFGIPALARFGGRDSQGRARARGTLLPRIVGACHRASRRRGAVLAATVALFAFAGLGIARLSVDTYTIGFLDDDSRVRRDHRAIENSFGPFIPLEMTADVRDGNLKEPERLRALDEVERAFETHPDVARSSGLVDIVKRSNQVWFDESPDAYAVPDDPRVVGELLFSYSLQTAGRDHLEAVVDVEGYRRSHITSRTGLPSAKEIQRVIGDLEATAAATTGGDIEVRAAGYLPLYVRIIQHITDTQATSFAIAFALVTLVLMALLRSVRLGLVAMVPNLLPALLTLGFMGWAGIRLDVATVLIAAIAIGISVNDTSHIMFRFKRELAADPDRPDAAIERMLHGAGRAVIASSLILMAGFGVLLLASVKSIAYFGLLSSATILAALAADLIITPTLLSMVYGRANR